MTMKIGGEVRSSQLTFNVGIRIHRNDSLARGLVSKGKRKGKKILGGSKCFEFCFSFKTWRLRSDRLEVLYTVWGGNLHTFDLFNSRMISSFIPPRSVSTVQSFSLGDITKATTNKQLH